jgi:ribosome maturation factor RimP
MTKPDRPSTDRTHGKAGANPAPSAEAQRLFTLLQPTVQASRLYLEDVSVHIAGTHRTVSVIVDLPETETGGLGLDVIAQIAQELSATMDADPHDDGRPYDLEVSSPGATRPLTEPRHWRRAIGRMVKVNIVQGENITGRILAVDDDGVTLRPEIAVKKGMKAKQGPPEHLAFTAIRRGNVEIEFSRLDEAELDLEFETAGDHAVDGEES